MGRGARDLIYVLKWPGSTAIVSLTGPLVCGSHPMRTEPAPARISTTPTVNSLSKLHRSGVVWREIDDASQLDPPNYERTRNHLVPAVAHASPWTAGLVV